MHSSVFLQGAGQLPGTPPVVRGRSLGVCCVELHIPISDTVFSCFSPFCMYVYYVAHISRDPPVVDSLLTCMSHVPSLHTWDTNRRYYIKKLTEIKVALDVSCCKVSH